MISNMNNSNTQYHSIRFIIDSDNWYQVNFNALGRANITQSVAGSVTSTNIVIGQGSLRNATYLWSFHYQFGAINEILLTCHSTAQHVRSTASGTAPGINMENITHVQFESFNQDDAELASFRNYGIYASKLTLG